MPTAEEMPVRMRGRKYIVADYDWRRKRAEVIVACFAGARVVPFVLSMYLLFLCGLVSILGKKKKTF